MPLALRALRTGACARFPHSWRQPCRASAQEVAGRDKRQAHVCTPRFQGGAGCCGNPGCTPKAAPAALPSRGALVGTTSDRRKKHWAQACQDQSTQQTHQECESMLSGHHSFRHQAVFLRLSGGWGAQTLVGSPEVSSSCTQHGKPLSGFARSWNCVNGIQSHGTCRVSDGATASKLPRFDCDEHCKVAQLTHPPCGTQVLREASSTLPAPGAQRADHGEGTPSLSTTRGGVQSLDPEPTLSSGDHRAPNKPTLLLWDKGLPGWTAQEQNLQKVFEHTHGLVDCIGCQHFK